MEASHEPFRGARFRRDRAETVDRPDRSKPAVAPTRTSFDAAFFHATTVQLKTDEVLFLVGDTGDGYYRVDDGLIKVAMVSHAGKERILAFLGSGAIVGELAYRRVAALGVRGGGAAGAVELS
jgi:CRP-like cAMP-binding protein